MTSTLNKPMTVDSQLCWAIRSHNKRPDPVTLSPNFCCCKNTPRTPEPPENRHVRWNNRINNEKRKQNVFLSKPEALCSRIQQIGRIADNPTNPNRTIRYPLSHVFFIQPLWTRNRKGYPLRLFCSKEEAQDPNPLFQKKGRSSKIPARSQDLPSCECRRLPERPGQDSFCLVTSLNLF